MKLFYEALVLSALASGCAASCIGANLPRMVGQDQYDCLHNISEEGSQEVAHYLAACKHLAG